MQKKYWRRVNSILFVIAFFAPWLRSCGVNTLNGFQFTILFGLATSQGLSDSGTTTGDQSGLLFLIVFMGLLCLLLYALINLIFSFRPVSQFFSRLRIGSLIGAGIGMLGSLALTQSSDINNVGDYLWGYWLTWVGVLSSLGVEILEGRASTTDVSEK